jgi:hypothetical protein
MKNSFLGPLVMLPIFYACSNEDIQETAIEDLNLAAYNPGSDASGADKGAIWILFPLCRKKGLRESLL